MTGHAKAKRLERENAALQEENAQLKQALFSRQKGRYSAALLERTKEAEEAAKIARKELGAARAQIFELGRADEVNQKAIQRMEGEIKTLKGYNRQLAEENNEVNEKLRELQPRRTRGMGGMEP